MNTKAKKTIHGLLSILVTVLLLAPQGQAAAHPWEGATLKRGLYAHSSLQSVPDPNAPAAGKISVYPTSGAPGSRVLVQGSFPDSQKNETVRLWWDVLGQGRFLGSTQLRSDGRFDLPVVIPPEAVTGEHSIIADINYGIDGASVPFTVTPARMKALYLYNTNLDLAKSFQAFLDSQGFVTTLVKPEALAEVQLRDFKIILIGGDTRLGNGWAGTAADVKRLSDSGKPILGLAEGGAWFFEVLGLDIGWMHTAYAPAVTAVVAADPGHSIWKEPYPIFLREGYASLFSQSVVSYDVYLPQPPRGVLPLGHDPQDPNYYPLAEEDTRFFLWGYQGGPSLMTAAGRDLFVNGLWHMVYAGSFDTLVLTDLDRMESLGYTHADVVALMNDLDNLIGLPAGTSNMVALHRDLSDDGPAAVQTARTNWDADENSLANTNAYVAAIDSYIEGLKSGSYKNLMYVIIVGAHEIIPQKPRPTDDMASHPESSWASGLPQTSGYLYSLYHDTSEGKGLGHYLTDSVYSDLSYVNNFRGADNVLIPELAVGRLVETPAQISVLVQNYISSSGTLSRTDMAAIGSSDYMDGAQQAADNMDGSVDTALIQSSFNSSLVPPKMNAKSDIIYIGGHGNYNWVTTGSGQGFMAGSTSSQGDTEELSNLPNAVIVASGCHNGVNFGNKLYHDYAGNTTYGEFPERYANKQVGVYLGSSGYTWISASGSSSNVAYNGWSEKLATHFLKHLMNDGMFVTVGKAYKSAVNEYVSDYGTIVDEHRRVISIVNLYGIPNYRWPRLVVVFPLFQVSYWIQAVWVILPGAGTDLAASPATQAVTFQNAEWSVEPDGLINIPGAKYTGNSDEPILPVVDISQVLPSGSHVTNITFDEVDSESVTIPNDLPLTSMAVLTTTVPNAFEFTGFYPPTPFYTTTLTTLGGDGVQIDFSIIPVQYDPSSHQTRIWTRMNFLVEYDLDPEAMSLDSDGDGLPNYWEIAYGLDPDNSEGDQGAEGDPDGDGLTNTQEHNPAIATNPMDPDTDNDGFLDGVEYNFGSNPLNPGSRPNSCYLPLVKNK